MGASSAGCLCLLVIICTLPGQETRFINFKNGYEYVYRYEGHSTIKDLGKFIVKAKVSVINDYFELCSCIERKNLGVYSYDNK